MNKKTLYKTPLAIQATDVPPRAKSSIYPKPFATRMRGHSKRPLGDYFGLTHFGVNLTLLQPHSSSTVRHWHSHQDEFIYILQGHPILHTNEGKTQLAPGMTAGFKAGNGNAHRLLNETDSEVLYLEVGDRSHNDVVEYPDEDLKAIEDNGQYRFLHKDGTPYPED